MSILLRTVMVLVLALPSMADARSEESLQDVPIAVSTISEEQLNSLPRNNLAEMINKFAIVQYSPGTTAQLYDPSTQVGGVQSGQQTAGTPMAIDGIALERLEIVRETSPTYGCGDNIIPIVPRINSEGKAVFGLALPSQFDANPAYRFNGTIDPMMWEYVDQHFTHQWRGDNLTLPYGKSYAFWRDSFGNLTWENVISEKGFGKAGLSSAFGFYAWETNKFVEKKASGYPNDPLFPREGQGKTGTARKVLGSLLSVIDAPVAVSKNEAKAQWGLPETGFHSRGKGQSAWDLATGEEKNVIVAVIDSGLDLKHKDRPQYVWTNADEIPDNGIDDDRNGYVDDVHGWNFFSETNDITDNNGHGTFVAGIIAAKTNNGEGMAGINPGAQIMPLKVFNKDGESRILAVYRAIRYAVDNGACVINLSLGGKGITRLEQIGINYAYAMGRIVVVAAGNESSDIARHGPPGARRAFSVAAMDMDGKPREFSNRGLNVAVTAPGQSIYSLAATDGNRDGKFMPYIVGDYFRSNGTSFSAPFVAGAASLLWSKYPGLSHRKIEDMILQSARDVHDPGWDRYSGYGLLDGHGAFQQDPDQLLVPRITEVYVNQEKRRIYSVDLYGVVRGNLDHYTVWVGSGKNPSKWQQAQGPVKNPVEYRLIGRIDGAYFKKGSKWTVRLDAVDRQQRTKSIQVLVSKARG